MKNDNGGPVWKVITFLCGYSSLVNYFVMVSWLLHYVLWLVHYV